VCAGCTRGLASDDFTENVQFSHWTPCPCFRYTDYQENDQSGGSEETEVARYKWPIIGWLLVALGITLYNLAFPPAKPPPLVVLARDAYGYPSMILCPMCGGPGWFGAHRCDFCHGKGWVTLSEATGGRLENRY
jgi:hypothetical protein